MCRRSCAAACGSIHGREASPSLALARLQVHPMRAGLSRELRYEIPMKARQCKDVPDVDALRAIDKLASEMPHGVAAASLYDLRDELQLPPNLVRAKIERLIDRGLVDGCACGCRGDFTVTEKGRALLVVV